MFITEKKKFNYLLATLSLGFLVVFNSATIAQQLPQQQPEQQKVKEDFSEKELTSFVEANKKVTKIQTQSQQKMMKAIEEEGLSVDRFNEILTSQQEPEKEVETSADEMSSFNNAAQVIMKERQETEVQMVSSIEKEGLDINTYQEIMYAYQQSPKVQKEVNKLLKD